MCALHCVAASLMAPQKWTFLGRGEQWSTQCLEKKWMWGRRRRQWTQSSSKVPLVNVSVLASIYLGISYFLHEIMALIWKDARTLLYTYPTMKEWLILKFKSKCAAWLFEWNGLVNWKYSIASFGWFVVFTPEPELCKDPTCSKTKETNT